MDWSRSQCVHDLVAAQAARTPDAVAVENGPEAVRYAELEARSDRLARTLRAMGVGPEVPVGVFLPRSAEMIVAVLAILKAGGAYLPLDPAYPSARLGFMLSDCGAPVIVTRELLVAQLPADGARVVLIDEDLADADEPLPSAGPDHLAYVIYTSGSTGQPKGVAMPHAPLVNLLSWQLSSWDPPAGARTLQLAPLSFDVSFQEIFSTLVAGGTLILVSEEARRDPQALWELIGARCVERVFLPFVLLDQLANVASELGLTAPGLREVFTAGEQLKVTPAIRELFSRHSACTLRNQYGPTETHVVTEHRLEGDPAQWPELPPIGLPIAGAVVRVLDERGEPVPEGQAGELYLGGACVAREYVGRPELTAERFLPDRFSADPHARLYRSGDFGRLRHDCVIEYLGRDDDQVKIRGYRVELGEVEAALARLPGVAGAVAVARSDDAGERRLLAYVIPANGTRPTATELRRCLLGQLPSFMVPSVVTLVERFPQTPSGKVDRAALPDPAQSAAAAGDGHAGPRGKLEAELVAIFEDELKLRAVRPDDDLFSLGVSSLRAARLFVRLERTFGSALPRSALFQAPTPRALAELLHDSSAVPKWTSLVPLQRGGARPPLFVVHGGAGTIMLAHPLARRLGRDQPVYGLQARGLYGHDGVLEDVESMAGHYVDELREVQPKGPYLLLGYCFGAVVAHEMALRLRSGGESVGLLAMVNGTTPDYTRQYEPNFRWAYDPDQPPPQPPAPRTLAGRMRDKAAVRTRIRRRVERYRVMHGLPIPEERRNTFFLFLHWKAERRYHPEPYPGRVLVFRGGGLYDDPALGWDRLAAEVELVEVPTASLRPRQAMDEPHVEVIARRIEAEIDQLLARAQTGAGARARTSTGGGARAEVAA